MKENLYNSILATKMKPTAFYVFPMISVPDWFHAFTENNVNR